MFNQRNNRPKEVTCAKTFIITILRDKNADTEFENNGDFPKKRFFQVVQCSKTKIMKRQLFDRGATQCAKK